MKRIVREPLFHFLLLGAVIFAVHHELARPAESGSNRIVITGGEVAWLKTTWERQWQREPNQRELQGLVQDYLRELLLAREARELKLDDGDTVVRRRLAQKMIFLLDDSARTVEPTQEDLQKFFQSHPERYRLAARISFDQIYFNPDQRGPQAKTDASSLRRELNSAVHPVRTVELGDATLLPSKVEDSDARTVADLFGREFSEQVFALSSGTWQGPISSGFGLHLVRVIARQEASVRPFAEVRDQVLEEWRDEQREKAEKQYFATLLNKYQVVAEKGLEPLVEQLVAAREAKL